MIPSHALPVIPSERCEWRDLFGRLEPHARGCPQCRQHRTRNRHDDLCDKLNSLFLCHNNLLSFLGLIVIDGAVVVTTTTASGVTAAALVVTGIGAAASVTALVSALTTLVGAAAVL